MSPKARQLLVATSLFAGSILVVAVVISARNRSAHGTNNSSATREISVSNRDGFARTQRNLMRQPEAFNLSRRLGVRFASNKREKSFLVGTLTIGSERRNAQTTRTQTDDGEELEIRIAGSSGALTWDRERGAISSSGSPAGSDRELIERLVFDSPDQFVLAQLRGASYYTIARNVRPAEAGDGYSGPTWNIVRVDHRDPQQGNQRQSSWRLYYLNTTTGLIDRIVGEVNGEQIVAELTWTESSGEKVPARITWKRQGHAIMEYSLTNFSHADQGGAR